MSTLIVGQAPDDFQFSRPFRLISPRAEGLQGRSARRKWFRVGSTSLEIRWGITSFCPRHLSFKLYLIHNLSTETGTMDRRQFLTRTSAASVAAAATLPGADLKALADHHEATGIPPHRAKVAFGMHAYPSQISVEPGQEIDFHTSSTVPYELSICRLGDLVDDPANDEVLHTFEQSQPLVQPIHPGSYVHVDKGLDADKPLLGLTFEVWVRAWAGDEPAGIITQMDLPGKAGVGLMIVPSYGIGFYVGDGSSFEDHNFHYSGSGVLKRGQWHHVVGSWNGNSKSIWVDGKQVGRWTRRGEAKAGNAPLRIGARSDYGEAFRLLDGDIAMPVIYDRGLSGQDIQNRFEEKGLKTPSTFGVLGCWPLSEEKGSHAQDVSDHKRHGQIVNEATWMIGGPSYDSDIPRYTPYDPAKDETRGHGLRLQSDDLFDCRWKPSHTFKIPADAKTGFYVGRYRYSLNNQKRVYHALFVVKRPAKAKKKPPIVLLAATNTYRAYTSQPFAEVPPTLKYNDGHLPNSPGDPPRYSFYRGHKAGSVTYQLGQRMPSPNSGPYVTSMGGGLRYNYSHLARADRLTEVWLANNGYEYDVVTDTDLDKEPGILTGYKTLIINGHSEYWSIRAMDEVQRFLEKDDGSVAVLSGNTMFWRVTYNDDGSIIECRKIDAPGNPIPQRFRGESYHSHDGGIGGLLRDCGRPAWEVLGLETLGWEGGVASMGPFVCDTPDHFLFNEPEKTGLKKGERFGQAPDGGFPRAGGHEFDVRVSTIKKLQQGPIPKDAIDPQEPDGIEYLGHSKHIWNPHTAIMDYYTRQVDRNSTDLVDLAGEMIYWERPGGGRVFHAGVIAGGWVLHVDPKFQAVMRNALAKFGVTPNKTS